MTLTLTTRRMILRPPAPTDAPRIAAMIGERDVARMLNGVPYPYTIEDAQAWLSGKGESEQDIYCILDAGDGAIGVVSLTSAAEAVRVLGFWLGKPYWGQGLMSEAVAAMVAWGFGPGGSKRLDSSAFTDNAASRRIHAKLGFREGGSIMLEAPARERPEPGVLLSLSREDWTPLP